MHISCIGPSSREESGRRVMKANDWLRTYSPTQNHFTTCKARARERHVLLLAGPNQRLRYRHCPGQRRVCPRQRRHLHRALLFLNRVRSTRYLPHTKALPFPHSPLWPQRRSPRTLNPLLLRRTLARTTSATLVHFPPPAAHTRTKTRPLLGQILRCRSV